uniref:Uncharacterized protein n=1 Tax=Schlesneria paludicola TaxID=360056 RepID=A0A7C2P6L1_9PLAN
MAVDADTLRAELRESLRRTAELRVAWDLAEGRVPAQGVPHYSLIEAAAHAVGREVSRLAQALHMGEVVARQQTHARCPACGTRCGLSSRKRTVTSGDGPVELQELVGRCPACHRDFFPSAGRAGV